MLRVRFRCLDAVAVPQALAVSQGMDLLMAEIRSALERRGNDELLWIPLALLDFLCIHPFTDGNGRVGRLLTLLLLYRSGWILGRYISLERLVEDARVGYYDSQEASSSGWHEQLHDPLPWCRYLWGVLLRATGSLSSASMHWRTFVRARAWRCHGPKSVFWCARPACANWCPSP